MVGSPNPIEEVLLIPSSGGVFEVEANGRQIHSKKISGQHADPGKVLDDLAAMLAQ
jgi:selT/selW/selH-like putative selenoprotein